MSIDEAIKILDPETSQNALLKYKEGEQRLEACNEACRLAASALRAQQTPLDRSQWEGCPICTAHYTKQDWNTRGVGAHEFRVSGSSLMYCDQFLGWKGIGINFCPKCGRPLTEAAWAEMERRINDGTADVEKRD